MGTVSDRLEEMGHLAASFYFASYTGSAERKSKRRFVATLAYQLQRYPGLKKQISIPMMNTIQEDPAVFKMNLKEQMEKLVLRPLRESGKNGTSDSPMIIVVDGVDECGEDRDEGLYRAREQDQIEVLSVILQAMRDAAFPCRFIVASRPESWIRRFFTDSAAGHVTEVFLDDSYNPDKDIKLFLDSKFAELGRRYGYRPSTWPKEEDVAKLVENASGQFIYAATVIRFVDTPPYLPQDQLNIVLSIRPRGTSSPFRLLDALYTSILKSSPSPLETVMWFQSILRLYSVPTNMDFYLIRPISAWTIERLFESSPGQAKMVLEIPSLVYLAPDSDICDASHYIEEGPQRPAKAMTFYVFYHKSFLDFLRDPARLVAAFPDVDQNKVERWVWARISRAVECDGPEVPLDPKLLPAFTMCLHVIWALELQRSQGRMVIAKRILANSSPMRWLKPSLRDRSRSGLRPPSGKIFGSNIFVLVHKNCQPLRPCRPGCKRWREAIEALPSNEWRPTAWNSCALFLDRSCLKRLPWVPETRSD